MGLSSRSSITTSITALLLMDYLLALAKNKIQACISHQKANAGMVTGYIATGQYVNT